MNRIVLLISILVSATADVFSQPYFTGHLSATYTDASRGNRSIPTEIYYPSVMDGDNEPAATGVFPLIIFGHGFVMDWSAYENIWLSLTHQGFIVAFPKTETGISPSHDEFAKDIAFLVTTVYNENLNNSSILYQHIDTMSAVMGHSMGGGAALLSVQYNNSIDVVATLAAAETTPSAIAACALHNLPSLYIAGGNDCVTPPSQHQLLMYNSSSSGCKSFVSVTGGSHCQFAENNFLCNIGEASCSPAPAISRAFQHAVTDSVLIPWLKNYLFHDCIAGIEFQDLLAASPNITSQQNCIVCQTGAINTKDAPLNIYFADGKLFYPEHDFYSVSIFNASGSLIIQKELKGNYCTLDLEQGWYLLRVTGKNGICSLRVML